MRTNNTFSSDDDDSRDDRQLVLDDATRDMTKMELRILCAKLKDKCNAGETKLKKSDVGIAPIEIKREEHEAKDQVGLSLGRGRCKLGGQDHILG